MHRYTQSRQRRRHRAPHRACRRHPSRYATALQSQDMRSRQRDLMTMTIRRARRCRVGNAASPLEQRSATVPRRAETARPPLVAKKRARSAAPVANAWCRTRWSPHVALLPRPTPGVALSQSTSLQARDRVRWHRARVWLRPGRCDSVRCGETNRLQARGRERARRWRRECPRLRTREQMRQSFHHRSLRQPASAPSATPRRARHQQCRRPPTPQRARGTRAHQMAQGRDHLPATTRTSVNAHSVAPKTGHPTAVRQLASAMRSPAGAIEQRGRAGDHST